MISKNAIKKNKFQDDSKHVTKGKSTKYDKKENLQFRPTVDGINLATPKGFDMESRKPKPPRKSQKLGTIVHLPARMDAILKKIILTLQAASAYTHFRGGVMGSNADVMENGLKPKEYVYPSNSSKIKKIA